MHKERGFRKGSPNPTQRAQVVGAIGRACREGSSRARESAHNRGVALMKSSCRTQGLIEGTEHDAEHDAEGSMETADRIQQAAGVRGNGRCDPGMSELEQQRALRAKKEDRLPFNAPRERAGTKQ